MAEMPTHLVAGRDSTLVSLSNFASGKTCSKDIFLYSARYFSWHRKLGKIWKS